MTLRLVPQQHDAHGNDAGTRDERGTAMGKTVERHEIEAWLGSDWRPGQVEEIVKRIQSWEQDHADASEEEQAAVWEAVALEADFRLSLGQVAAIYQQARDLEAHRRMELRAAVWVLCKHSGLSEAEATRITGMNRGTIHAWITE